MQSENKTDRSQSFGSLCVIISAILFGCSPLFAAFAYNHGGNSEMAAFGRFFTATILLAFVILFAPKQAGLSFRISRRQMIQLALISIMFAGTTELLFMSYPLVGSGLSTTLHFTYPVDVIVIMALFYHERPTPIKIFCAVLCIAGVLCLYTPGASGEKLDTLGVFVALASGVTFSLYVVWIGKGDFASVPVLVTSFWVSAFSAILSGIYAQCTGTFIVALPWQAWLAHTGLGFFTSVFGTTLLQKGIFLCGGVKASLLSNLEPLTATFLGVLVFHETLTLRTGLGVVCILVAAVLTSRK